MIYISHAPNVELNKKKISYKQVFKPSFWKLPSIIRDIYEASYVYAKGGVY